MIVVTLYKRDAKAMPQIRTLEFFGTPVAKADGSS